MTREEMLELCRKYTIARVMDVIYKSLAVANEDIDEDFGCNENKHWSR